MPPHTICVRLGHIQLSQAGADLVPYLDEHHLIPAVEATERIRRDSFSASSVSKRGTCGILDLIATRNKGMGAGLAKLPAVPQIVDRMCPSARGTLVVR